MTSSTGARVALVTGGSGGIGRVVAERLVKEGFAVAVHYAGNKVRADETLEAITAAGGTATWPPRSTPSSPVSEGSMSS